ncbi:MAG: four helix bundle protein, partial [Gemmatimonadales bacterium]
MQNNYGRSWSTRNSTERCSVRDFRELKVWGKAHALTLNLYKLTRSFPKEELYRLTAQIRRAAASIGANIAEGCGRRSRRDFARFLQVGLSSASELQYHLLLAADLELLRR